MICEKPDLEYDLYVFGTGNPATRAVIDAHLWRGCKGCVRGVDRARLLADHLAIAAPPEEPPAYLRGDVLRAAAKSMPRQSSFWESVFWRLSFPVSAVAALALLLVTAGLFTEVRSLNAELRTLRADTTRLRERDLETRRALANLRDALRLVPARGVREVRFTSGKAALAASGRLYLHPQGLVMFAAGLEPGHSYQLWLVTSKGPMSAGVFVPGADGSVIHIWPQDLGVSAIRRIAISEEPAGGSESPAGKILITAPVR